MPAGIGLRHVRPRVQASSRTTNVPCSSQGVLLENACRTVIQRSLERSRFAESTVINLTEKVPRPVRRSFKAKGVLAWITEASTIGKKKISQFPAKASR
jgi:hypothetical protein